MKKASKNIKFPESLKLLNITKENDIPLAPLLPVNQKDLPQFKSPVTEQKKRRVKIIVGLLTAGGFIITGAALIWHFLRSDDKEEKNQSLNTSTLIPITKKMGVTVANFTAYTMTTALPSISLLSTLLNLNRNQKPQTIPPLSVSRRRDPQRLGGYCAKTWASIRFKDYVEEPTKSGYYSTLRNLPPFLNQLRNKIVRITVTPIEVHVQVSLGGKTERIGRLEDLLDFPLKVETPPVMSVKWSLRRIYHDLYPLSQKGKKEMSWTDNAGGAGPNGQFCIQMFDAETDEKILEISNELSDEMWEGYRGGKGVYCYPRDLNKQSEEKGPIPLLSYRNGTRWETIYYTRGPSACERMARKTVSFPTPSASR